MTSNEKELIENSLAIIVRDKLRRYGIDEEALIKDGALKGIRNAAIGIYRIVLHQTQRDYDQQECNPVCTSSSGTTTGKKNQFSI